MYSVNKQSYVVAFIVDNRYLQKLEGVKITLIDLILYNKLNSIK